METRSSSIEIRGRKDNAPEAPSPEGFSGTTEKKATPKRKTPAKARATTKTKASAPRTRKATTTKEGAAAKPRKAATQASGRRRAEGTIGQPSPAEIEQMIATAAYFRAEKRNFAPGYELEDWIAAEHEIRRRQESRAA
jgi:hypothetical protein